MIRRGTLRELFTYDDWAHEKLLATASGLSDQELDRPFEMGLGSLRNTLNHLYAAERVWLDRWVQHAPPRFRADATGVSMPQLRQEMTEAAVERNALLERICDADLQKGITYTNLRGQTYTYQLGQMMLHVCNHGVHHRAQVLNMMKQIGAELPKPGLDYIFMKLAQPGGGTESSTPPELDVDTLRTYYGFADWARDRTHEVARGLGDEQLDRPFEIGVGSLRVTLAHIRFAEEWWYQNWTLGPGQPFPEAPVDIPIAEVERLFADTAARRTSYLSKLTDAELARPVTAMPRPNVTRVFPLGVTMLQIVCHGTHHRAQALNMFRHCGAEVPGVDFIRFIEAMRK
jgi:uncharacterized damage-inducible protein DinB